MKTALCYLTHRIGVLSVLAVAFAMALSSCFSNGSTAVPRCEITEAMDSLVDETFPDGAAPGAVIFVTKNGEVVYKRTVGLANLETGEPLTENTLLNISSASKTFAVAGIMKLIDRGLISLDTPLSYYFPDYNKDVFDKVNITHILTHTTCLPDNRPRNDKQWERYTSQHPESPFGMCNDYMCFAKDTELTRFYSSLDSLCGEPGTVFLYQDPPFMLLSQIIEKVTGEKFETWMKKNIFEPAELETVCYTHGKMEGKGIAHGYRPKNVDTRAGIFVSKDSLWEEYDYGEAPFFLSRADKGIFITPKEYVKWLNALYRGKVIERNYLDSANVRRMEASWRDVGYGFGSFVSGGVPERPAKIFHNNGNGGFTVFESVFPDDRVAYFIFSNYFGWNRNETGKKVDRILEEYAWIGKQKQK